jgi:hypothetical protein
MILLTRILVTIILAFLCVLCVSSESRVTQEEQARDSLALLSYCNMEFALLDLTISYQL